MKRRIGFVSNSSSSSFVCCICGEECSGVNMTLMDAEMVECERGHVVCNECMNELTGEIDERERMIAYLKRVLDRSEKYEYRRDDIPQIKLLLEGLEDNEIDIIDNVNESGFMEEYEYGVPSDFCPVCQMKRVLDDDMLKYLLQKFNIKKDDVIDEIQTKFKTFEEFNNYNNPKNKDEDEE